MDLREVCAGIMMIDWMQKNVSHSSSFYKWKIKTNLKVLGNGDWELCRSMYEIIVITFDASWIIFLSLPFLAFVWIISITFFRSFIGIFYFHLDYFFHLYFLLSLGPKTVPALAMNPQKVPMTAVHKNWCLKSKHCFL